MSRSVTLGAGGVEVSRLGLGTAFLARFDARDEQDAIATVEAAWAGGVRYFDTAPLYGLGAGERLLGAALAGRPRDSFTISTKVGRPLQTGPDGQPESVFDFSTDATLRSLDASLSRLRLDRVDVAFVHDPGDHLEDAMSGAYATLHRLRDEGLVRAIGVGVTHAWLAARFIREAELDCVLVAGRYTLLDQQALDELLPLCVERGVSLIAGGVFNSGLLADPVRGALFDYAPADDALIARARRLADVCGRHDVPLKAAALQFPLGHPAVASVVVGARRPAEQEENQRLIRVKIPPVLWKDLETEGLVRGDAPAPAEA